ncbi:hypothetical protein D3C85_1488210 [compost metagenome]
MQLQPRAEQGDRQQHAQALDQQALEEQALATGSEIIHGHHRQDGHAGQRVELQSGGPEPAHQRVQLQVAVLGVVRNVGAQGDLIGQVRPGQAVEQQQAPDPGRHRQAGNPGHYAEHADPQADDTRQVNPPYK